MTRDTKIEPPLGFRNLTCTIIAIIIIVIFSLAIFNLSKDNLVLRKKDNAIEEGDKKWELMPIFVPNTCRLDRI